MESENSSVPFTGWRSNLAALVAGAILFGLIANATGMWPYVLILCAAIVFVSLIRFVPEKTSRVMFVGGIGGCLGVAAVIMAGLFASPSNDGVDIEDRTDWEPPKEELSPQELLALDWSSYDLNAHWPVASLMLELSDIAYLPPSTARAKIQELGWESESINAGSMQGYVIDAGDDSIVTFRGTEGHEYDIVQDLRFIGVNTEQGSMHGGFAKGYDLMHDQVVELLKRYQTKRVWLTGHSLGGGLAVVCAHRLLEESTYPIAGMMTFGQPKVVRSQLAGYLGPKLSGKYVFFVNDMDPVTRVISPYEHFGHMVRWNDNDIERSQMLLMSTGPDSPAAGQEAGYIEEMTHADFQELLRSVEESSTPKFDENGNQLVQGFVPNVFDHYLDAYREMLDQLRTHSNR
ncbi:Lipase (class 3) [Stieleria bergensis]|uniref:Lipase (Class 3) n=2 Tax=Stieleria bergensis TaxID=2528025 RepID=A0A517STM0_9BACT|nr:Lipase (class 3) [Planctomycetes bacterium SV_7m_r]